MAKAKNKKQNLVKRTTLMIRLTEEEKQTLQARAAEWSLPVSSWARMTLLSHSKEV